MTHMTTLSGAGVTGCAFGTMQFGGTADLDASEGMYAACRAAGIAHFDTAHVYTEGASERILGRLIAPERDAIFVATKAGYTGGSGAANLRASVETSRDRLQTDVLDMLYLHRWDDDTPLEETFETLADLQRKGAIRYIGVSNFAAWQVMKAQAVAAGLGTRIDAIQPMYSLVKRQVEVEILPMAKDQEIAVFAYSPLGGGLLTGKYAMGGTGRLTDDSRYAARYAPAEMHAAADGLMALASAMGTSAATLAVAWAAAHPAVTGPILSARSTEQLGASLDALTFDMEPGLYREISQLFPAPPPATDRLEEA